MNPTTPRPAPQPVNTECCWLHTPLLPCPAYPDGLPGMVWIESTTQRGQIGDNYIVTPHLGDAGQVLGWRFIRGSVEGDVHHDIDHEHGGCDCPDSLFRRRACKHLAA